MSRSRPLDTVLAAAATIVVSWPLTTLLSETTWIGPSLWLIVTAALVGSLGRARELRGWQILALQLAAGVLLSGLLFARSTLFYGLPTFSTVWRANALILNAEHTVQSFSAPAPTTPGLIMLVACILGVVAITVDYLAATRRSPAMAGLALLAAFLGCAANSGSSMHPIYFLAAAAVWLAMMSHQGKTRLQQWSTTAATPATPVRDLGAGDAVAAFGARARNMAIGGLAVALLLPVVLPHLPTRYLLTGLGRSENGVTGGSSFGFSQSADLARDLGDRSSVPVLTYRTTDPAPQPLRVSVTTTYVHGTWVEDSYLDEPDPASTALTLDDQSDANPDVVSHNYVLDVKTNSLRAPALAVPARIRTADLDGSHWRISRVSGTAQVDQRPSRYTITYSKLDPSVSQLESSSPAGARVSRASTTPDIASLPIVLPLAQKLTRDQHTAYDKAMAIQQYFRANGHFTYSLKLAGPAKTSKGVDRQLDPLSNFLVTKKGYCVQFATGMVMLARAVGIPARLAMGFLPGTASGKDWTVKASDAHAWPELYFAGLGWTRFEPTPAERSGTPPAYAVPSTGSAVGGGRSADQSSSIPTPSVAAGSANATAKQYEGQNLNAGTAGAAALAAREPLWQRWLPELLALLIGIVGALVVPTASWWRRRSRLHAAEVPADRVEAEWCSMTERLADLGMPPPLSQTPRQLGDYYDREAYLRDESAVALQRAVGTLEQVRYARPTAQEPSIAAEARTVIRAARLSRRRGARLRAVMVPASGLAQIRRVSDTVTGTVREGSGSVTRFFTARLISLRTRRRP